MTQPALPDDLKRCVDFHGHLCPGLLFGYRAARAAMDRLGAAPSEDEEIVAVVENNSCAVDAIQVLLSCTFGKGNLIFRDYGKMVFTFYDRANGRSLRVSTRAAARTRDEMSREERIGMLLTAEDDALFDIGPAAEPLAPPEAVIHDNVTCDLCGEPMMDARAETVGGRTLCIPCGKTSG